MLFKTIFDWSEVWSVLIALLFYNKRNKSNNPVIKPVLFYLITALIINILIDVSWKYKPHMPAVLESNNFLYNIQSICRLCFFTWFFCLVGIPQNRILRYCISIFAAIVITIHLIINNSFYKISSVIFGVEGFVLLFYCVTYFLTQLRKDEISTHFDEILIIVTGLSIFEAVIFPIFLFYDALMKESENSVISIWPIHNVFYIIFCLFIARSFFGRINYGNH